MDKLRVRYPVIVEGKYDKIALSSLFDTPVFSTGGFAVFNSDGTRALLRRLAEKSPVILLTDSDGGGRQIRAFLSEILPPDRVIHLYIPQIPGNGQIHDGCGRGLLREENGIFYNGFYHTASPITESGSGDAARRRRRPADVPDCRNGLYHKTQAVGR